MIKFFLKVLVVTEVLAFLGLLVGNLTMMGLRLALADALVNGTALTLVLTLTIGTLHVVRVRKAAGPNSGKDLYSFPQVREVSSRLDPERAFSVMRHYLEEVARLTVTSVDQDGGRLEARSGLTLMTLGNRLSVHVAKREGGGAHVTVTSRPLFFALADYGESVRTADAAADHLRAQV